ncbi:hypothetical protein LQ327_02770 [Actinomycetospora endophytica]|uniref:Uncharacterized protein n=1 Tax=Actinomycetospora endophytica TaxID=2291215 RepID=A0ABS8P2J6_9PSEU|nr:hypothetical protein [Actinomycetospora endophytica]MCD2192319.1 hypothetical protein [Actinomycetospora endophytica]
MVGHDGVATATATATAAGGGSRRLGTPVIAGLGIAALVAIAVAVLVAVLGSGTATAQSDPGPQPYGGALERIDPGDQVSGEEVLEVAMLSLGTLNGLAFTIAMIASRLRGPSTAQTRRALIARTGEGVVSESRRERRERARLRARRPVPSQPIAVVPGGPRRVPQVPPPGAVPAQGGPAPREGLVPAAHAPRPAGYRHPAPMSPPVGVPAPVRPASRR